MWPTEWRVKSLTNVTAKRSKSIQLDGNTSIPLINTYRKISYESKVFQKHQPVGQLQDVLVFYLSIDFLSRI